MLEEPAFRRSEMITLLLDLAHAVVLSPANSTSGSPDGCEPLEPSRLQGRVTDSWLRSGARGDVLRTCAIVDASVPSFMLTHWGRDRSRGPGLPLTQLVKMQTSETADFFGFTDRGRLAPGLKADINLIDFERLRLHQPEVVSDLPAGGRRLVQRVDGYRATIVAGEPVFENGEDTGARPGRLVRAGRPT
jgi:N-acyl-D-aspartate/D-glutamate deacylase